MNTELIQCNGGLGRLGQNGKLELNDLTVECKSDYAVIALSSLNNDLVHWTGIHLCGQHSRYL